MKTLLTGIIGGLLVAVIFCFAAIFSVLAGAFVGMVASWFFDDTIRSTLLAFGVDLQGIPLWQVGATLGFVGSFFKSTQTVNQGKSS